MEVVMDALDILTSANSGPIWGFGGALLAVLGQVVVGRRQNLASTSSAALSAINDGNKQLVEGLFQQVKVLTGQVETLRGHTEECEARHREAMERIAKLERSHAAVVSSVPTRVQPGGLD
jgi:ATP/maltotriose-dependent transcriptional regulator MalT